MTAAIVIITVLIFIAAMLCAVMLIAWRSFGRPRHALVWALAFAVATAQWFSNLALRLQADDNTALHALTAALGCLSNALIAVGFVQRNRAPRRVRPLLAAALVASLLIGVANFVEPVMGIRYSTGLGFGGLMMLVSAFNVAGGFRQASLPERAVMVMLTLFAAIDFSLAAIAMGPGTANDEGSLFFFRSVVTMLYPIAFTGVGLFSVFLVAADLADDMRRLATSDMLTGVYNRRGFEDSAERAIRNAQRQRQPLSVVVADIDNFKLINDRHGHTVGDRALRHFASRLERLVRRGDLIGRIGGEEFALLLVNTRPQDALEVVERIRRDIAAMPVDGAARIVMTASFGVTGLRPGDISLASLLARADRALYRSKLEGRDRVTSADELEEVA
ncbi:sensor domain-containing diguanylate cyclase [Rhizorhabdus dicambivorans]|uniref:diguanylate cyclase n=1 Tax=Rhizorhabdus dicambivorans TaxID=1850238 RepID=A0A2A4G0U5_9SPHN|nr:GGDEF domain-containing protein [Rhizorhabdus dicambivorans]ATE63398.1 GGDEF domain-containing protein [Rhizorhabdus dicambivorans]PCE43615.1 GGDEF domain-containing protein [Rhizorhabdus dicambivorans]